MFLEGIKRWGFASTIVNFIEDDIICTQKMWLVCSGKPKTTADKDIIEKVQKNVMTDCRVTLRELTEVDISHDRVHWGSEFESSFLTRV